MLDSIPVDQRETASSLIKQAAADLGVPYDRARRILYWHAHRSKQKLLSMEVLKAWLSRLDALIRAVQPGDRDAATAPARTDRATAGSGRPGGIKNRKTKRHDA